MGEADNNQVTSASNAPIASNTSPDNSEKSNKRIWLFGSIALVFASIIGIAAYVFINNSSEVKLDLNCDAFPEKLDSCTEYKCQFENPFVSKPTTKEILGFVNNKCLYVEQMAGGMTFECNFTETTRKAAAIYYKQADIDWKSGKSFEISLGEEGVKSAVEGVEEYNPLNEALNTGECAMYEWYESPHGPKTCPENWACSSWSECVNNQQTRPCEDWNKCGTTSEKPITTRNCTL